MRVAIPSTAAQYFHLLRLQALVEERRPLVVFTPKSGLRLQAATSSPEELAKGGFRPILEDSSLVDAGQVRRLLFASGKVSHELLARRDRDGLQDVAIVRLELLYPFPEEEVAAVIGRYPKVREVAWVQEEPRNMGAYGFAAPRLQRHLPSGSELVYHGRCQQASPSEGSMSAHLAEQERLLGDALAHAAKSGEG